MNWLLDTNTLSYLLRSDATVRAHFEEIRSNPNHVFVLSPVVDFEFRRYTLLKNAYRAQARYEALVKNWLRADFRRDDWHLAATLWAERHRAGRPIDDADLLIAVTAIKQNAVLVTANTRHFADMGLALADWKQP